ncbi:MAG: hypothetical protein ACP6IP_01365 [Candidatus Njordarchaeia archaeon]
MSEAEILDRLNKAILYVRKINERFEELKDSFEGEKRATIEMVYMLANDLIELRNSLEKLYDQYIKLLEKMGK